MGQQAANVLTDSIRSPPRDGRTLPDVPTPVESLTENLRVDKLRNFVPNVFLYPLHALPLKSTIVSFLHNPKSGGTSVKDCMLSLGKAMNKNEPVVVATSTVAEVRENLLNHMTSPSDYYMGDAVLGICDYVEGRPCSYFTMVREPYERMVSHYYFCKGGGPSWPQCDNSLEEFALSLCSVFFRQLTVRVFCAATGTYNNTYQCERKISSIDHFQRDPAERAAILNYFLENLDKIFTVIGLTEEFETSLKIFEKTYGDPFHTVCNEMHSNSGSYENGTDIEAIRGDKRRINMEAKDRLMKNPEIQQCLYEDVQLYSKLYDIYQTQKRVMNIQ